MREYIATKEDMINMAELIKSCGGYINNHYERTDMENTLNKDCGAVVLLEKGELSLWFGGASCLNRCYIGKDGLPHLSTFSNGGCISRGRVIPKQDDIDMYNDSINKYAKGSTIIDFIPVEF